MYVFFTPDPTFVPKFLILESKSVTNVDSLIPKKWYSLISDPLKTADPNLMAFDLRSPNRTP